MELLALSGLLGALASGWMGWISTAEDRPLSSEIDSPSAGAKVLPGESERFRRRRLLRAVCYAAFGGIVVFVLVDFLMKR